MYGTKVQRNKQVGEFLQNTADFLCDFRVVAGTVLGGHAASDKDFQSWSLFWTSGSVAASDKGDGILSRLAAKLLKRPPTAEGGYKDQMSDKALYFQSLAGIVINAVRNRDKAYAVSLAGAFAVSAVRDAVVTIERNRAEQINEQFNLDEEDRIQIAALRSGQIKTFVNGVALAFACSPLTKTPLGQAGVAGLYSAGAILSVKSGVEQVQHIRAQEADLLERALIDPSQAHLPQLTSASGGYAQAEFQPLPLPVAPHLLN